MSVICEIYRLGLAPYQEAWDFQRRLSEEIAEGKQPATLLLLQHPHIFTFGRRGDAANLLWEQEELNRRHVQVLWVDRGGDVTYHGPGQLVGYPLIQLAPPANHFSIEMDVESTPSDTRLPKADYIGYLRQLEQVILDTLTDFGVRGKRINGKTGVWVDLPGPNPAENPAKIAAIGVKVDVHGVTRHGFALNVNPDMSYWDGIIGCGLKGDRSTSLADFLQPVPQMVQVEQSVISAFKEIFHFQIVEAQAGQDELRKLGLKSV